MTGPAQMVVTSSLEDRNLAESVTLESWEFIDADTQHLTHNIHRYSGKFIPQIAARAISILSAPGELILDPYCGSGTTLVEAAILGRRAVGIDLSPLAVLIARTKITPLSSASLNSLRQELIHVLASLELPEDFLQFDSMSAASGVVLAAKHDPRIREEWYKKWFREDVLENLIAIDLAIGRLNDDRCQSVARVAFSDILRRSSNAHSGYPNVMFDKNASERQKPVKPFLRALDRVCEMVSSLEKFNAKWEDVRAQLGSAEALPLDDASVDAIVSHPPYIGSIPYAEYGALSLKWLGVDPKALDRELTGGRRQSPDVVERFRGGYGRMMLEASRVLRPGRHMFLMVGNPVVKGETIDLAEMSLDLAGRAGLELIVRTVRKGVNRRANKMGEEHLLFFKKPSRFRRASSEDRPLHSAETSEIGAR